MKIHTVQQGSVDWELLRCGKVTASEMDSLVTPLGKVKTGDGPKTYLMKKLAEEWSGGPLPSAYFWDAEQGHYIEEVARPAFTLETGVEVRQVGFITTDDERVGCSPDGLIADNSGIEIKSPHIETHIRYLLDGSLPTDYVLQVQASMFVTGYSEWMFFSYRRRMPPLILKVMRDDKIQKSIAEAVELFNAEFDNGFRRLCEINGGPPKRNVAPPAKQPETENNDIIP